jgi:hypothetical protein
MTVRLLPFLLIFVQKRLNASCLNIHGPSKKDETSSEALTIKSKKTRSVIHLSLADSIPAHGPIADLAFSLGRNGVSYLAFLSVFVCSLD